MLFAALVLHPQLVQASGTDDIARAVGFSDVIDVTGVMQGVSYIRAIGSPSWNAIATSVPCISGKWKPYLSPP